MQEIHEEQNKDRTNITIFPFCLRLQYGSIWRCSCQWHRKEREKERMLGDGREEGRKETTYTEDSLWVRPCSAALCPLF